MNMVRMLEGDEKEETGATFISTRVALDQLLGSGLVSIGKIEPALSQFPQCGHSSVTRRGKQVTAPVTQEFDRFLSISACGQVCPQ